MNDSPKLIKVSSGINEDLQRPGFMKIIRGGFNVEKVKLPPTFWKSKSVRMPDDGVIILNGPFGGSWPVQLSRSTCGIFLSEGWKKFYDDHALVQYDLVLFKSARDSTLDVQIFGENGIEKTKDHPPVEEVPVVKRKRGRPRKNKDATNSPQLVSGLEKPQAEVSAVKKQRGIENPEEHVLAVEKKKGSTFKNKETSNSTSIADGNTNSSTDPKQPVAGVENPEAQDPIVKKKKGRLYKNKDASNPNSIVNDNTNSSEDPASPVAELANSQAIVHVVKRKRGRLFKNEDTTIPISYVHRDANSSADLAPPLAEKGPNNDQQAMATPSEAMLSSRKGKILSRYVESLIEE